MAARRLLFLTGSRGEWGYIRPILRLCEQRDDLDYVLVATNMHMLPAFGESVREIEADGFQVHHRIYSAVDGYNHITSVKAMGLLLGSMADVIASARPDWIVLAGDRPEQLVGAIASAFCYIPVAHIQAGELSGNIDGMTRHAIGKLVHLHLASNQDASDRLVRLGEEPFRVHNVGAPQLDELVEGMYASAQEFEARYGISLDRPYILLVQHPVTEEFEQAAAQIDTTMSALRSSPLPKFVILPNNDAGSLMIRDGINRHRHGEFHVFANLPREDYLCLMRHARCLIGNSSSGLLEAPTFHLPVVNLGRRQHGRVRGRNVIDAPFEEAAISDALALATGSEFRERLQEDCTNPYGDGRSAERILDLLAEVPVDDRLLIKNLTY
jgi:GDP/UDP-N,N'-diacetylbacillosamine 2-epimerase (hydrolysing)